MSADPPVSECRKSGVEQVVSLPDLPSSVSKEEEDEETLPHSEILDIFEEGLAQLVQDPLLCDLPIQANASPKPANVSPDISVLNSAATEPTNTAILELLQKLSEDQTKHFTDLRKERRAVVAVEEKLADVLTRIISAEAQLDMLEDTEDQRRNSPPALASEVETLNAKLVEYEDRDRRVNLRIYGLPEHSEEKDALSFLKTALPDKGKSEM
ncbi:hypothetical protein NQZ68_025740 [Dissostichus eleginoides]|nr:hypothetical protein NQZ68_025740 [Dissostichus eleginoides]